MIEQNGTDHGAFQKNLDAFEADGHISKAQKRSLMKVIELGHSVTHRAHAPSQAQITAALDVTESVIQAIYVDTKRIEKALQNLPPRRK